MAVIKYKGRILKEIYEGQRITLHTEGHELDGDLVIEGFNGDVAPQFSTEVVTVTPTKATQTIGPSKANFISKAVVKPIPDNYIEPNGVKPITENGIHDVTKYASIDVSVDETPLFDGTTTLYEGELVTFTIGGLRYMAYKSMRWTDWIDSEFNEIGYYLDDEGAVCITTWYVQDSENMTQSGIGIIKEGEEYMHY